MVRLVAYEPTISVGRVTCTNSEEGKNELYYTIYIDVGKRSRLRSDRILCQPSSEEQVVFLNRWITASLDEEVSEYKQFREVKAYMANQTFISQGYRNRMFWTITAEEKASWIENWLQEQWSKDKRSRNNGVGGPHYERLRREFEFLSGSLETLNHQLRESALNYVNSLKSPMHLESEMYDAKYYVYYEGAVYCSKLPLPDAQWMEAVSKLMRRYEAARMTTSDLVSGRVAIPSSVRDAVWRRDEGRCTKCGSRERLEFDHIIPVSKGGSSTERNIELLCEPCNRSKGPQLG